MEFKNGAGIYQQQLKNDIEIGSEKGKARVNWPRRQASEPGGLREGGGVFTIKCSQFSISYYCNRLFEDFVYNHY